MNVLVMGSLIVLGCANFLLFKINYAAFGEKQAFFVSQGINALYLFYGGAVLYPRMCFTSAVTKNMRRWGLQVRTLNLSHL